MQDLQVLMAKIFRNIAKLEDNDFVESSENLLNGKSKSSVLTAIFLEFENSKARSLITNLGFWFENIEYQDIMKAMMEIGDKGLSAYHFSLYVPEVFGVDVRKAALEICREYPEAIGEMSYFINLKQLIGPSRDTIELLVDYGASPQKIRNSLLRTGAPLLPLP